jgi:triacylglycerol lipase
MPELIRDIVLAHGIARFDILRQLLIERGLIPENDEEEYFKGIFTHLTANGFNVHRTNVAFTGPVDECAQELADQIKSINRRVHVIAHSQGGLNGRRAIVDHGVADNVAMLTTIDTPHHGSSFADVGVGSEGGKLFLKLAGTVMNLDGFNDITMASCKQFNERAADAEAKNGVVYRTYSASEGMERIFFPLRLSWDIIKRHEGGENDGLVSVKSQTWVDNIIASDGTTKPVQHFSFPFPADHLNVLAWYDPAETGISPQEYEANVHAVYLEMANSGIV